MKVADAGELGRRREGDEQELGRRRGGRGGGRRAAYDPPAVTTGGRERGSYLLTSKYSRLSTSTAKHQDAAGPEQSES